MAVAFDREIHAVVRSPVRVDSAKLASEARNRSIWRSFRVGRFMPIMILSETFVRKDQL